jgi:hypothetical protein
MTGIEQHLRDELHRVAGQLQPEQLRQLRAPARRGVLTSGSRWVRAPRPAVFATALVVIAALAIVIGSTLTSPGPPTTAPSPTGMPGYYVTVQGVGERLTATVRDSADGHVTGTVTFGGSAQDLACGLQVAAAADDRHFVIDDVVGCGLAYSVNVLYTLLVSPAGQPGKPVQLTGTFAGDVSGMAVSPDGSMLALTWLYTTSARYGGIEAVNLVNGATGMFGMGSVSDYQLGAAVWTDGDAELSALWWHEARSQTITGIRQFDVTPANATVRPGPLSVFPAPVDGLAYTSTLLTAAGRYIIAGTCRATAPDTVIAQVRELSAANGRVVRLLLRQRLHTSNAQYWNVISCPALSVNPTGQHILIGAFKFGRLDDGVFTLLPGPAVDIEGRPPAVAW